MKIDPNAPAFPAFTDKLCIDTKVDAINCVTYGGLTIRAHFAAMAM